MDSLTHIASARLVGVVLSTQAKAEKSLELIHKQAGNNQSTQQVTSTGKILVTVLRSFQ